MVLRVTGEAAGEQTAVDEGARVDGDPIGAKEEGGEKP
jgi:hypothetical protein